MYLVPDHFHFNHIRRYRLLGTMSHTARTKLHEMWTSIMGSLDGGTGRGRQQSYNYLFAIPDL